MRLLFDTHVFLWAVTANRRLKSNTQELPVSAQHAAAVAKLPLHHSDRSTGFCWLKPFWSPCGL